MSRSPLTDRIACILLGDTVPAEAPKRIRPIVQGGQGHESYELDRATDRALTAIRLALWLLPWAALGALAAALVDVLVLSRLS